VDGVFHIAKQIDRTDQDVVGENCVQNDTLQIALNDKMKAWVEHYARLLNVKELSEINPTAGPPPSVSAALIHKALSKMKCTTLQAHLASSLRC